MGLEWGTRESVVQLDNPKRGTTLPGLKVRIWCSGVPITNDDLQLCDVMYQGEKGGRANSGK